MPKLIVELKQHTPIYHFQFNEEGVSIRGTEIKPALDRFLLKCADENVRSYRIKSQDDNDLPSEALDYRVKIHSKSTTIGRSQATSACNLIGIRPPRNTNKELVTNEETRITFLSAHIKLLDCIKEWIGPFIACHNFGHQKLKGLGSYSVAKIGRENYTINIADDLWKALGNENLYEITATPNATTRWDSALGKAAVVRSSLKVLLYMSNQRKESPFLFKPVADGNQWHVFVIKRNWSDTEISGAIIACKEAEYNGRQITSLNDYNIIVDALLNIWKEKEWIKEVKCCE